MSDYWNLILKIIKLIYKRKENIKMYIKTYENCTNDNKNIDFFLKKSTFDELPLNFKK